VARKTARNRVPLEEETWSHLAVEKGCVTFVVLMLGEKKIEIAGEFL
jgi:hypothetical protein